MPTFLQKHYYECPNLGHVETEELDYPEKYYDVLDCSTLSCPISLNFPVNFI